MAHFNNKSSPTEFLDTNVQFMCRGDIILYSLILLTFGSALDNLGRQTAVIFILPDTVKHWKINTGFELKATLYAASGVKNKILYEGHSYKRKIIL